MIPLRKQYFDLMIEEENGCFDSHAEIFNEVLDITKPKNILEIGFYRGGSANLWLMMSDARLLSVDPIFDNVTNEKLQREGRPIPSWQPQLDAVQKTTLNFPDRFEFIQKRTEKAFLDNNLEKDKYGLAWIDGDHWFQGVIKDIQICMQLNIPYFLFDDFNRDVVAAFHNFQQHFEIIKEYDKTIGINYEQQAMLLVKNKEYREKAN